MSSDCCNSLDKTKKEIFDSLDTKVRLLDKNTRNLEDGPKAMFQTQAYKDSRSFAESEVDCDILASNIVQSLKQSAFKEISSIIVG